jgi:hypothetical protein
VGAAGNSGVTDGLAPAEAAGAAAAAGDGTGMAVKGVLVFMKTDTVMVASSDFQALLGEAAAALGAAAALIDAAGTSDKVDTTVDLGSRCRAAVNC